MGTPKVTPITENRHTGGYVIWDPSDGMLTREAIILIAGSGLCTAGLVLGGETAGGAAVSSALETNTGNGTIGAITVGPAAQIGEYAVVFDDATHFTVNDPAGAEVGSGTTGAAFDEDGIGFTITAGATAFAAGDGFTVTTTGTVKFGPWDPTASDGLAVARAILWSGSRDATTSDADAVANVRGPMRVNASELIWGANVTTDAQKAIALAQLEKLTILNT
ncbi:head decoration protein [Novosphingobium sp. 9]|uniref:head decoration protein n=1 Tax=Novosphingobium sp. 9 TaxID=2025349 RepID=UPI0021B5BCDE|nr:head decoration protein [Novosphingobium sp. 9]